MSNEALRQSGQRLQEAREAMGLTQDALGALLDGVEQATVSRWEAGAREPALATRRALARVLGCDPYAIEVDPHGAEAVA